MVHPAEFSDPLSRELRRNFTGRFAAVNPGFEKLRQCITLILGSQCALPDPQHPPAGLEKFFPNPAVAFRIASELLRPEVAVTLRDGSAAAARVGVPKTAVYENCDAVFGHHDVGTARQVFSVESETEAERKKRAADENLRPGVFRADGRHIAAPRLRGFVVGHGGCILRG